MTTRFDGSFHSRSLLARKSLIIRGVAKGRLLAYKRRPFSVSLTAFCSAICRLSGSSANFLDGHMALSNVAHYFIYKYILL